MKLNQKIMYLCKLFVLLALNRQITKVVVRYDDDTLQSIGHLDSLCTQRAGLHCVQFASDLKHKV